MISIRLWITKTNIVSYSLRPLKAIEDSKASALGPNPPKTTGDLISCLTRRLADRTEPTAAELNEKLDTMEEALISEGTLPERAALSEVRRAAITLRRYMLPLGRLTGLLGINVGDIPSDDNPNAFWIVCAGLVAITGPLIWLFHKWGLL